MNDLLRDATFWTALGAVATVFAALGALVGVLLARHQLREMARQSGSQTLFTLYALLDDDKNRGLRRQIWHSGLSSKEPSVLSDEDWAAVERTATVLDVVGTIVKHNLVREELVFERYAETILPLWGAIDHLIQYRRQKKGGFGWQNSEWLADSCRKWSKAVRGTDTYQRF